MFFLKHGSGKSNKVVDVLSQRTVLLNTMLVVVVILECVKGLYVLEYERLCSFYH
jgi:hypothetical protein